MTKMSLLLTVFFFQAEDGIRYADVTGVQTCALPICCGSVLVWAVITALAAKATTTKPIERTVRIARLLEKRTESEGSASTGIPPRSKRGHGPTKREIGRASCRERQKNSVEEVGLEKV